MLADIKTIRFSAPNVSLPITPLILTFNEEPNIARSLAALKWATEILVVDSFSTDATIDIVKNRPGARLLQRHFDSFAQQCNFGLQHVQTPWVLSMDADYVLTPELIDELAALDFNDPVSGYAASFRYCVQGRPLRASLYPPRVVLYRKVCAKYLDEGHSHRVEINGPVRALHGKILHDDRKSLNRWLAEQLKYSATELEHLRRTPISHLNWADRVRQRVFLAPLLVLVYTLVWKRLALDGWPGWYYALQRTFAEIVLSLRIIDRKLCDPCGNADEQKISRV